MLAPVTNIPAVMTNGLGYDDLARRYTSDVGSRYRKITCEFTRDPALIYQYEQLHERALFGAAAKQISFSDVAEESGDSQVIVAYAGRLCVGGGSLSIATPALPASLPMEKQGITLSAMFPALDLPESCYGEISDIVIMDGFDNSVAMEAMVRGLVKMAALQKLDYLFSLTPLPQARLLRQHMHNIGVACDIRRETMAEDATGVKKLLSVMDIAKYRHMMQQIRRESLILLESQ